MNIFDHYRQRYEAAKDEEFTLQEFLTTCRQDRSAYANAAERLLMAIGEPVMVDTAQEPRLSRLFSNRVIARYPAFEEFYGMEDAIEQIVSYLKHAAQGLEEKKQILYLLGPVGGGKSSLAERLKSLMQLVPIYVLSGRQFCNKLLSPKRNPVMRTTRTSPRWLGKSIFVNSNTTRRMTRTPTAIPVHCAAPTRGSWNSLRCLKHRLKCCIPC